MCTTLGSASTDGSSSAGSMAYTVAHARASSLVHPPGAAPTSTAIKAVLPALFTLLASTPTGELLCAAGESAAAALPAFSLNPTSSRPPPGRVMLSTNALGNLRTRRFDCQHTTAYNSSGRRDIFICMLKCACECTCVCACVRDFHATCPL
jgi:hypothetical protein